eukprot:3170762-Pleurochrysis_carterae.AAC.1
MRICRRTTPDAPSLAPTAIHACARTTRVSPAHAHAHSHVRTLAQLHALAHVYAEPQARCTCMQVRVRGLEPLFSSSLADSLLCTPFHLQFRYRLTRALSLRRLVASGAVCDPADQDVPGTIFPIHAHVSA